MMLLHLGMSAAKDVPAHLKNKAGDVIFSCQQTPWN